MAAKMEFRTGLKPGEGASVEYRKSQMMHMAGIDWVWGFGVPIAAAAFFWGGFWFSAWLHQ